MSREDYERRDIFRVYETWKRVQENIERRAGEKTLIRVREYKKYGLLKAGISGSIDRPTLAQLEVEKVFDIKPKVCFWIVYIMVKED